MPFSAGFHGRIKELAGPSLGLATAVAWTARIDAWSVYEPETETRQGVQHEALGRQLVHAVAPCLSRVKPGQ